MVQGLDGVMNCICLSDIQACMLSFMLCKADAAAVQEDAPAAVSNSNGTQCGFHATI